MSIRLRQTQFPNYLKVGDTYRAVSVRLKEWEAHYPNLEKTFEGTRVAAPKK